MRQGLYYEKDSIKVRDAVIQDVWILASQLRKSDIEEIWACSHHAPTAGLIYSFHESTMCFTVEKNGQPIAMFGIAPDTILGITASIWLLASDELVKIRRRFIRHSRVFIDYLLSFYPQLYNFVDARNLASINWLKWCGAEIEEAHPYGLDKLPFHYFTFRRN